ncbi:hypothetical protein AB0L02_22930 [Streptomyces anulatus]|uniref:hypothetical protein n=1 Tax=Streptomyces anulatus TaxID=1892 RepID=UPI003447EA86
MDEVADEPLLDETSLRLSSPRSLRIVPGTARVGSVCPISRRRRAWMPGPPGASATVTSRSVYAVQMYEGISDGEAARIGQQVPVRDVGLPRFGYQLRAGPYRDSGTLDAFQHGVDQAELGRVRLAQDDGPAVEVDTLDYGAARRLPAHC